MVRELQVGPGRVRATPTDRSGEPSRDRLSFLGRRLPKRRYEPVSEIFSFGWAKETNGCAKGSGIRLVREQNANKSGRGKKPRSNSSGLD